MKGLWIAAMMLVVATAQAGSPWDKDAKEVFRDRCQIEARKNKMVSDAAAYCACYSDALEQRFGKEQYPKVTRTRPDPEGSPMARAMSEAAMGCVMAGGYPGGY